MDHSRRLQPHYLQYHNKSSREANERRFPSWSPLRQVSNFKLLLELTFRSRTSLETTFDIIGPNQVCAYCTAFDFTATSTGRNRCEARERAAALLIESFAVLTQRTVTAEAHAKTAEANQHDERDSEIACLQSQLSSLSLRLAKTNEILEDKSLKLDRAVRARQTLLDEMMHDCEQETARPDDSLTSTDVPTNVESAPATGDSPEIPEIDLQRSSCLSFF